MKPTLKIQIDRSGVGHCWITVDPEDLPCDIAEEIYAEMIDGNAETCDDYIASNGQHYRW